MIKEYVKKPVKIQACIWTGYNETEIFEFCGDQAEIISTKDSKELTIHTLEGDHHASIGDYIIKGIEGEFYPCKPDIFEKTYDSVNWLRIYRYGEI